MNVTTQPLDAGALRAALVGPWAQLDVVERTGSTNADLLAAATAGARDRTVLVAEYQEAGRGRMTRSWVSPPGTGLTVSVLLRPVGVPASRFGWLPLLTGLAVLDTVRRFSSAPAGLKWPNDVLIGERKVCGVLAEALPDGQGVVLGAGLNHRLAADQLPVPTATSLAIEGGPTDPDVLIAAYLAALPGLLEPFEAAGGDPERSGLRSAVEAVCGTIGRRVRIALPDGSALVGRAVRIDGEGRIEVVRDGVPGRAAIASGDVEHLRYE
jgi:BirA family transcriptional regulator, biotin operon repressor / biotin---[acetyl-CoA-carboxylase] ligase